MYSLLQVMVATPKHQCSNHILPLKDVVEAPGGQSLLCSNPMVPMTRSWKGQLLPFLTWALSNPVALLSSSTSSSTASYTLDFQTNLPSLAGTSAPVGAFPGSADPVPRASPNPGLPMGTWLGVHSTVDSFHNIDSPKAKTTMFHLPKPKPNALNTTAAQLRLFQLEVKAIKSYVMLSSSNHQDT